MHGIPNTLTFRLTLGYTSTFIIFLVSAFLFSFLLIESNMNNEMNDDLSEDLVEYDLIYQKGGVDKVIDEIIRDVKSVDNDDEFVQLFDSTGQQIFSSDVTKWKSLNNDSQFFQEKINAYRGLNTVIETISIPGREHDTRIAFNKIGADTILMIGESLEQIDETLELMIVIFSAILVTVIPFASLVGWLVVRHSVSGIKKVSKAAVEIENGNLDTRVEVLNQRDEIQNLADTFNSMAERIQTLISEMREMIENIAHDLRSPLGRIRVISEMALSANGNTESYKTAAAETIQECDQLIQLINISLDVAEAEAGIENGNKEEVNITELINDACELFEPVAEDKNIEMTILSEPGCIILGQRQNLQRMIANIIDNALKYTPENGKVGVELTKVNQTCHISVSDTGIGIPEADQQRVFDRFYRCDQSRSHDGNGLGLSFARAVAHAHGGKIMLSSEPDVNTVFEIILPATI